MLIRGSNSFGYWYILISDVIMRLTCWTWCQNVLTVNSWTPYKNEIKKLTKIRMLLGSAYDENDNQLSIIYEASWFITVQYFTQPSKTFYLRTKRYDNRDDFDFPIVNFPLVWSNVQAASAFGVYISQVIRYSRVCGSFQDFLERFAANKEATEPTVTSC